MAETVRKDPKGRNLRIGETYEEKTGRYRYSYADINGKRRSVYSWTLTKNDLVPKNKPQKYGESLREKEQKIQSDLSNSIDTLEGNMSIYSLMERWVNLQWGKVRETTRNGYRTQLKFMEKEDFGKRRINSINATEAEEYFDYLHRKKNKGYSSLHTLKGILNQSFRMAKRNRWITSNPFDLSLNKKKYGGEGQRDAISRNDMRLFLDFLRTDKHFSRYFYGIYILFNTGLRISEFCGLIKDDIDFKNHVIHVKRQLIRLHNSKKMIYYIEEPKTKNGSRDVPMFGDVELAFHSAIENLPDNYMDVEIFNESHTSSARGFLWWDKNNNLEVAQHWQNHLRWACAKYNRTYKNEIPNITPHMCRHTFCSNMAVSGMNPKTLQLIMGHASIEMTLNVYTHIPTTDVKNEFFNIVHNKNYDLYPFSRVPKIVSLDDEDEMVEGEVDMDEEVEDD